MKKTKIVLIEDNLTDLSNLIKIFQQSNSIEVKHTFINGLDFIHFLEHTIIDVDAVIIDYRMPLLNGLEIFRILKYKNPKFKILLVSHAYYGQVMKEVMGMGNQNYCQKSGDLIVQALPRLMEDQNIYEDLNLIHTWDAQSKSMNLAAKDGHFWSGMLSPLFKKIIKLMCIGLNSIQIGNVLGYEASSIEKYRGLILKMLDLKNSQQLTAWAFSNDLVTSSFLFHAASSKLDESSLNGDEIALLRIFKVHQNQFNKNKKRKK